MAKWEQKAENLWVHPETKDVLQADSRNKAISTFARQDGNTEVRIPLTVMRSLLEDMGYKVEKKEEFDKVLDALSKTLGASLEATLERDHWLDLARERDDQNYSMLSAYESMKANIVLATKYLDMDTQEIKGLKKELKDMRDDILRFAHLLIEANVSVSTKQVGEDLKKKFDYKESME